MASGAQGAVLEPASPSALNTLPASPPPLKKRKRSHNDSGILGDLHTSQFTIRPHSSSSSSEDCNSLVPITLLPRSRLPLSWLDPCSSESRHIPSGNLFISNIPALERDLQSNDEPLILVARLLASNHKPSNLDGCEDPDELYVIERVKRGVYALCALGSWVKEGDLLVASKGPRYGGQKVTSTSGTAGSLGDCDNWLEQARISDEAIDCEGLEHCNGPNVSLVFGPSSGKLPANARPVEPKVGQASSSENTVSGGEPRNEQPNAPFSDESTGSSGKQPTVHMHDDPSRFEDMNPQDEPSRQEFLDGFRNYYLESLYISKTSVAYFAKGPLSRIRAAFQSNNEDSTPQILELCGFYREYILPMKKMDLKYRDTVPESVRNLPPDVSEDELARSVTSKTKKPKSKRKKIGKNGLYPEEQDFIARWWRNRRVTETSSSEQSKREEELKRQAGDLRTRETQLQILLILETMALESTVSKDADVQKDTQAPSRKAKKPQDLSTSLDLLLDSLCIWHAVDLDSLLPHDGSRESDKGQSSTKQTDNDKLKDFCTEVIMPFYAPRLPEQCKAVNKKLGGPVLVPSPRPETNKRKSAGNTNPGAAVKRTHPARERRPLHRVMTDENPTSKGKNSSSSQPGVAPGVPTLKRESSEPVLLSHIRSARGGIQKPRRQDNREVDLDTVAKQHENKARKVNTLMEQKKELDAAISALRKPNRELVARDFADSVEKRSSGSQSHPRKQKNPVRSTMAQGVQVMATPKGTRKKDCDGGGSIPYQNERRMRMDEAETTPREVAPYVATQSSSAVKDSPIIKRDSRPSISETPCKTASEQSNRASTTAEGGPKVKRTNSRNNLFKVPSLPDMGTSFASSPTGRERKSRDFAGETHLASSVQDTPARAKPSAPSLPENTSTVRPRMNGKGPVPSTPTKQALQTSTAVVDETPVRGPTSSLANATSIYDTLGWNDDDDELGL